MNRIYPSLPSVEQLNDLFGGVSQDGEAVVVCEVSHQLHEELDVSHLVQQVLVPQLLRLLVADGLHVGSSAFAVFAHDGVLDHGALLALQILHLI